MTYNINLRFLFILYKNFWLIEFKGKNSQIITIISESKSQKNNENKINSNQFPHPLETKQQINEKIKEEQNQNQPKKNFLLF